MDDMAALAFGPTEMQDNIPGFFMTDGGDRVDVPEQQWIVMGQ